MCPRQFLGAVKCFPATLWGNPTQIRGHSPANHEAPTAGHQAQISVWIADLMRLLIAAVIPS
jgi:hypothetical protein